MKIYLAGLPGGVLPEKSLGVLELFKDESKIQSYFHSKEGGLEHEWFRWAVVKENKVNFFLDSGAFSAWTQGIQINIYEYIEFIKKYQDVLEVYANLDVIGNAEASWKNQMIMEDAGLNPLPIFHYKEDEKWLRRYLKKGYEYIAIGGMVISDRSQIHQFLDRIYSEYLTDSKGYPIVKVHGFGLSSLRLMLRYPWYSVDSTSWVMTGRMGSIYIPRFRNGEWIYDENSWKIAVSSRSPKTKDAGQHIDTLPPKQKQIILHYINEKGYQLGKSRFEKVPQSRELTGNERWFEKKPKDKTVLRLLEIIEEDGISNRYQLRDEMNIIYFQDLEKSFPAWPWPFKHGGVKGFVL